MDFSEWLTQNCRLSDEEHLINRFRTCRGQTFYHHTDEDIALRIVETACITGRSGDVATAKFHPDKEKAKKQAANNGVSLMFYYDFPADRNIIREGSSDEKDTEPNKLYQCHWGGLKSEIWEMRLCAGTNEGLHLVGIFYGDVAWELNSNKNIRVI